MKKRVILIATMVIFAGCAGCFSEHNRDVAEYLQNANQYVQNHSTDQIKEAVAKRQLIIGMNQVEVHASIGLPHDKNKTVGAWGVHEQWIYLTDGYDRMYLYFEDGILSSWQD